MHPLVVDRTFLWALAIKFGIYAAWGLAALFTGVIPVRDLSGNTVGELIWSGGVFALSAALVYCLLRMDGAEFSKRWELAQVPILWAWLCVVGLYPIALIVRWTVGDLVSPHVLLLGLGYLVIPTWWLSFLIRKNKKS
jgi:hypothetical protein